MTELERMEQAEGYIKRYFEFEEGVTVSQENKEYLKTYIRDVGLIEKEYDFKKKVMKSITRFAVVALVVALLFVIPFHHGALWLVPAVVFLGIFIGGSAITYSTHKYKRDSAVAHQKEVNDGIQEQIEILDTRIVQLEKQRDDYLAALKKRIDFMELDEDYMRNISLIREKLENGEAETCEEAVDVYEQSMLLSQMNNIMKSSEHKPEMDMKKNMERFGDPLKTIEEKKKKKKKEKKK